MNKKTGLIIGILAGVAVLLAGAAATYIFAGDYIANKWALSTKSETEYFRWLAEKKAAKISTYTGIGEKAVELADRLPSDKVKPARRQDRAFKLHVTDEFCDLFNLYYFRDEELDVTYTTDSTGFGLELVPKYDDKELLRLRFQGDTAHEKFYAQLPTYNKGIIDLSSIYDVKIDGNRTVSEILREYAAKAEEAVETFASSDDEEDRETYSDKVYEYLTYLINTIEDVEIDRDGISTIGNETVEYTLVTVRMSGNELKSQLKGLVEMFENDGAFKRTPFSAAEVRALLDRIDNSVSGRLDLYVDNRANILGFKVYVNVNETKVNAEFTQYAEDENKVFGIELTLNSIRAANIELRILPEDEGSGYTVAIKPGNLVKSALATMGSYGNLSLMIEHRNDNRRKSTEFSLLNSDKPIASVSIESEESEAAGPVIDTTSARIYPLETILETDYINIHDLIGLALDIRDKINEEFVDNFINSQLQSLLDDGMSIDSIREMYELGLFGEGAEPDAGDAGDGRPEATPTPVPSPTPIPTPTPVPPIPGIASVEPDEFVPAEWEYPKEDAVYHYTHEFLADFATLGTYSGISYTVPLSDDVTTEQFEREREKFLNSYNGAYLEDPTAISVEFGDEVYFDIIPIIGGRPISFYSFTDCYALIGQYTYGEGLDDQIVGMKVGEIKDLEVTLGEQYGEFAGFSGTFRFTLTDIDRPVVPEWTEDFVCGKLGYESLDACNDFIMQGLIEDMEFSEDEVTEILVSMAYADYKMNAVPDNIMNNLRQEYYDKMYAITAADGQKPEEYFYGIGYTRDDFIAMMDEDVVNIAFSDGFYAAIAAREGITLSGSEVIKLINGYMKDYGVSDFDSLMEYLTLDSIIDHEIEKKVSKLIFDKANLSYK